MSSMLFSEAFARWAGSVAVSVLWQGALVGLVVSLLLARTKSPRARHTLACLGLLVMAALLPVNFIGSASMGSEAAVPARFATSDLVTSPTDTAPLPGSVPHQSALATAPPAGAAAPPSPSPAAEREPRPRLTAAQWYHYSLPWLGRVWAAGILLFALYDLAGLVVIQRMRRRSHEVGADIAALAERIKERMGVKTRVRLRWLEGISSALLTGWIRVVIFLPMSMAARVTPESLEAILAHEFAHIRRWDPWINALQRVVELLLFFHPVVWWLSAQIRAEREFCCDEAVLRVCPDRALYVRALLTLAESGRRREAITLSSHGGRLTDRVRRILGRTQEKEREQTMQGRSFVALIALGIASLPFVTALVSAVSGAQALTRTHPTVSAGAVRGHGLRPLGRQGLPRQSVAARPQRRLDRPWRRAR
jgi:beta-lactamase regulating signal transducer with metallopeptidase domain